MATQKTSNTGLVLGFGAAVLQCLPRIPDSEMQAFLDNPQRLKRNLATAFDKISTEDFDEAAYFKTRPGLYVDPDLEHYVGFTTKPARGLESLTSYALERNTSEADFLGTPGSDKRAEVMAGAVDLSQIAGLIGLQPGGIPGKLLNNRQANIFPVIGKKGELCLLAVGWNPDSSEWAIIYSPWGKNPTWLGGGQVFSNKL